MAEQNLNIYQKLAKIRKQVEVIQRNKKGYGYTYVSEDEILAKISGFMDISEDNDADYILWNGNRPQIKRKKFEEYIDRHNLI